MNNKWLKVLFIFSLTVNGAVLGALGYSIARQYFETGSESSVVPGCSPEFFPPQVLSSRADFQKRLFEERAQVQQQRNELSQLLMQQPPDRQKIKEKVKLLNEQQGKIQQAVVAQILSETSSMTAEQKQLYLSSIQGRMCQHGMMGRCGRGPGFRGRMGFGRNMPCQ
jgi:hypothetical protein